MQVDATFGEVLGALDKNGLVEKHAGDFHERQRLFAAGEIRRADREGAQPQREFARDEGRHFRRRPPHSIRGALAGEDQGEFAERSTDLPCRPDGDLRRLAWRDASDDAGVDSVSILPALLGRDEKPLREALVHHSINGSFAVRQGNWKLELCPGSGGWSAPKPGTAAEGKLPPVQLYDLGNDIAEQHNVQENIGDCRAPHEAAREICRRRPQYARCAAEKRRARQDS